MDFTLTVAAGKIARFIPTIATTEACELAECGPIKFTTE